MIAFLNSLNVGELDSLAGKLDEARRARLIAFVEASERMPPEAKERVLAQLRGAKVPARVVARLESRMGG